METVWDVCIIGSGPAAHTAAIYASRANLTCVLFEGDMANGMAAGGQLTTTTDVENFPGFPEGIMGGELCDRLKQQSMRFGTHVISETVCSVDTTHGSPFEIRIEGAKTMTFAKSVIVATGASSKRLVFKGSEEFWNKGISACAVCDGAAPIFRNKPIVVIGGGDSAMEEATFLTKYASKVYIVHRRGELRASKIMQERVKSNDKINIIWNAEVTEAYGDDLLRGVKIWHHDTQCESNLDVAGVFFAVGHTPASGFLQGQVHTDEHGYILTEPGSTKTNIPGIFAAGDVQDKRYRQAITAAASGCMAALDAEHWLSAAK